MKCVAFVRCVTFVKCVAWGVAFVRCVTLVRCVALVSLSELSISVFCCDCFSPVSDVLFSTMAEGVNQAFQRSFEMMQHRASHTETDIDSLDISPVSSRIYTLMGMSGLARK